MLCPMQILKMLRSPHLCIRIVVGLLLCAQFCATLEIYLDNSTDFGETCKDDEGQLLSYNDVLKSMEQIMELLNVDQSVRLPGAARFSPYITFLTCYHIPASDYSYQVSNDRVLNHCVSKCSQLNKHFVGFMPQACFCLNQGTVDDIRLKKLYMTSSVSDCAHARASLLNNTLPIINDTNFLLYQIGGNIKESQELDDTLPSFKQCRFVKRNEDITNSSNSLEYIEKSCSWEDVSGFICDLHPAQNVCTETYANLVNASKEHICIVNKRMSLLDAESYCLKNNGTLAYNNINVISDNIDVNSVYLVGGFREFQIDENSDFNDNHCVTVRKTTDSLLLETVKKCTNVPSLCSRESTIIHTTVDADVDDVTVPTTDSAPRTTDVNTLAKIIGISVGCMVLIVINVTLIIKLAVKLREQRSCSQPTLETNDDAQNEGNSTRTNPLFEENASQENANADSYSNADINKQQTSGIDKHYALIQDASDLGIPEQRSNIYVTPITVEPSHNVAVGPKRTRDSAMFLPMSNIRKENVHTTFK